MAAVTMTNYRESYSSSKREITANIVCAATADTWVTGLGQIDVVLLTPTADVGDTYATFSGGTVTFGYDGGGAATFNVFVRGS